MTRRSSAALGLLLAFASACLDRRSDAEPRGEGRCTSCHGSTDDPSQDLVRSAPPSDLYGNTAVDYPGVGAHSRHLLGGPGHAPVRCDECHVVPQQTHEPGHVDSDRPAELVFGSLATTGARNPQYDVAARRCSNTYCHGTDEPLWTKPRTTTEACGTCHGLPPAPPHPQSEECFLCHENVRRDRSFIAVSEHVDGVIQALPPSCSACHGTGESGAPPPDTRGNDHVSSPGVGAHRAHLEAQSSRRVECAECHRVPASVGDDGHLDPLPAELIFAGVSTSFGREPSYDSEGRTCSGSWCHSPGEQTRSSPEWTASFEASCAGCHELPPRLPHPQIANCSLCHAEVVDAELNVIEPARHVDGRIDALDPNLLACNDCHGGETAAPPRDLSGSSETSSAGVGAHAAHLVATDRARSVRCTECHTVPQQVDDPGHMDDAAPAEVVFSGPARAFGATPEYRDGTCTNTFCHGGKSVGTRQSGGTHTQPNWTVVDGTQVACGGCHAIPPPWPHLQDVDDCSECHENVDSERNFIAPETHVDGIVTFLLP